ncbi:uncharacterized protein LOC120069990 [Benincasa hispida]|uniref:uncharacterized protein LOC120069990 n=1 Tax=Benincasa hispida TaxID=102211 RepID=UPI001900A4F5|nr:uncharacterized protein LOC120069990 [Benincasa hispida]
MGQIEGELNNRKQGALPNTIEIPHHMRDKGKEQCQTVTLRSERMTAKVVKRKSHEESKIQQGEDHASEESVQKEEQEPEEITTKAPSTTQEVQPPPFPQRLEKKKSDENQYRRFLEILKQLHINTPFVEAIEQMATYAKFLKDIITKKRSIGKYEIVALTQIEKLMPTSVTLQLADRSLVHPEGKLEDVLVKVDKFILPVNFIILDYEADKNVPIILERPFLSTGRAQIDVYKGEIAMNINGQK